jgi:folate-binding protein YgfZ
MANVGSAAILDLMTLLLHTTAVVRREVGIVKVAGHDRLSYLHSLLSQDVASMRAGGCADFLYLDHKANPGAAGRAIVRAGDVLLVVPPELTADLTDALERYKFLMDVTAEAVEGWALASVRGPEEIRVPGMRGERMTAAPHGPGMVIHDRSGGADLLGPADWVDARAGEMAIPTATEADWQAWRIVAGLPEWGTEIVDGHRPQELGLLPTHVHLKKGCYPGQETIAKTWNLGRPRRALAVVSFDGPVEPAASIDTSTRPGTVTSVADTDDTEDGTVALALLPLDRDGALPAAVSVGDVKGTVGRRVGEGLVPPGA